MQRVVEYIARCPFSLGRMVSVTDGGKVVYRASTPNCTPFPKTGNVELQAGNPRNFDVFGPLDFLATVTQHIHFDGLSASPNKGEHQIRYYGWYSNKKRGLHAKNADAVVAVKPEGESEFALKRRMTWAALIKAVYEVDPLKCPSPVVSLSNHAGAP